MLGLNKVQLIGNLGSDPEVRYTSNENAVCSFSLATNSMVREEEVVTWHRVVTWNRQAELVGEYLKKGSRLFVEGRIQHRTYEDKEGDEVTITEIVAYTVIFLDAKPLANSDKNGNVYKESGSAKNKGKVKGKVKGKGKKGANRDDYPF